MRYIQLNCFSKCTAISTFSNSFVTFNLQILLVECPLCTRQMQSQVDQLSVQLATAQLRVNETKNLSVLQAELQRTQQRVISTQVCMDLLSSSDRIMLSEAFLFTRNLTKMDVFL